MMAMLALLVSAASNPTAQTRPIENTYSSVKAEVTAFVARTHVPSLSYTIVDGRRQMMDSIGIADLNTARSATPHTVFHLASLAKPFVAAAVLSLQEQGKLRLDDRVTSVLPYFRLADPRYRDITVRHLLLHTSGLGDVTDYGFDRPLEDAGALERYVRSLSTERLQATPGEKVAYSNIGYDILGDVIAKASGMSFEGYMAAKIFAPLGMRHSTFLLRDVPKAELAQPYLVDSGTARPTKYFPYNRIHAPSGTLYSSAADMARWLHFWLASGSRVGPITSGSAAAMLQDEATRNVKADEDIQPGQGIGWSSITIDGIRLNGHGGHDQGFRSVMIFARDRHIGVVLMTNGDADDVDVDGLSLVILGKLLGKDWSRFAKTGS